MRIDVTTPGSALIEMDVFTTAFRKIVEHTIPANGGGTNGVVTSVEWDLRDRVGASIANGLYYVRLHVSGVQESTKIFKVLVIR